MKLEGGGGGGEETKGSKGLMLQSVRDWQYASIYLSECICSQCRPPMDGSFTQSQVKRDAEACEMRLIEKKFAKKIQSEKFGP